MEQSGNGLKEQIHLKASGRHWRTLEGGRCRGEVLVGGGGEVRRGSDNRQRKDKKALHEFYWTAPQKESQRKLIREILYNHQVTP